MSYRLSGRIDDRPFERLLSGERQLLGASAESEILLDHVSVSRCHAEIEVLEEGVEVVDLGSLNGTYVDGERITKRLLREGGLLRFGQIELRLDWVDDADAEVGVSLPVLEVSSRLGRRGETPTTSTRAVETFAAEELPGLLALLLEGQGVTQVSLAVGHALLDTFPIEALEVRCEQADSEGVLFRVKRGDGEATADHSRGGISISASLASEGDKAVVTPVLESALSLIVLAARLQDPHKRPPERPRPRLPKPETATPAVRRIYEQATQVAGTDVGVLICGESGTGKELLARYVHAASLRAQGQFVAINCAALPKDLLESELFGIEKGVATGVGARPGKFEFAHEGTLFLDEIGEMAADTQAAILRVLQEREVYRLGSDRPRPARVRILAATNRDIRTLMTEGSFREDLYYRIAAWVVELPPLRCRRPDITNLSAYFLAEAAAATGKNLRGISRGAVEVLEDYSWPGNIRQLQNEMARAVAFVADGGLLDRERLSPEVLAGCQNDASTALPDRVKQFEKREILNSLRLFDGDVSQAADALGMPRSTLYRRMKTLEIGAEQQD